MQITFEGIGKRYRYEWIFKNINYQFLPGQSYAILGPNGSGKSTLLKIISGHLSPSKGTRTYLQQNAAVDVSEVYKEVSLAAPYIDLIEEMTLVEALDFHQKFKTYFNGMSVNDLLELMQLESARDKAIQYFSSGMKQRLKLALAICTKSEILILDEPTTNLDDKGAQWYLDMIQQFSKDRLVIIASNVKKDFQFCQHQLDIRDYKSSKGIE